MPLTKKEDLWANWERVAVFSCDILNLQVLLRKTRTETLILSLA